MSPKMDPHVAMSDLFGFGQIKLFYSNYACGAVICNKYINKSSVHFPLKERGSTITLFEHQDYLNWFDLVPIHVQSNASTY